MKRPPRANSIAGVHQEAVGRMRSALGPAAESHPPRSPDDALLLQAEARVRRTFWLRKTLPLNLILFLPGILFVGSHSKTVLAIFVATYPLVFVLRAILGQGLSSWIGSEDTLARAELKKLRLQQCSHDSEH